MSTSSGLDIDLLLLQFIVSWERKHEAAGTSPPGKHNHSGPGRHFSVSEFVFTPAVSQQQLVRMLETAFRRMTGRRKAKKTHSLLDVYETPAGTMIY